VAGCSGDGERLVPAHPGGGVPRDAGRATTRAGTIRARRGRLSRSTEPTLPPAAGGLLVEAPGFGSAPLGGVAGAASLLTGCHRLATGRPKAATPSQGRSIWVPALLHARQPGAATRHSPTPTLTRRTSSSTAPAEQPRPAPPARFLGERAPAIGPSRSCFRLTLASFNLIAPRARWYPATAMRYVVPATELNRSALRTPQLSSLLAIERSELYSAPI
jgi:hypothetical protein